MVGTKQKKMSTNVSDPVADLLTRIRNANIAYKDETLAPVSKQSRAILEILEQEGYIAGFSQEGEGVHQAFQVREFTRDVLLTYRLHTYRPERLVIAASGRLGTPPIPYRSSGRTYRADERGLDMKRHFPFTNSSIPKKLKGS